MFNQYWFKEMLGKFFFIFNTNFKKNSGAYSLFQQLVQRKECKWSPIKRIYSFIYRPSEWLDSMLKIRSYCFVLFDFARFLFIICCSVCRFLLWCVYVFFSSFSLTLDTYVNSYKNRSITFKMNKKCSKQLYFVFVYEFIGIVNGFSIDA